MHRRCLRRLINLRLVLKRSLRSATRCPMLLTRRHQPAISAHRPLRAKTSTLLHRARSHTYNDRPLHRYAGNTCQNMARCRRRQSTSSLIRARRHRSHQINVTKHQGPLQALHHYRRQHRLWDTPVPQASCFHHKQPCVVSLWCFVHHGMIRDQNSTSHDAMYQRVVRSQY